MSPAFLQDRICEVGAARLPGAVPQRRARLSFPVLLVLLAARAGATGGGPRSVELLGHDPATRAVYYLEHDGSEAGEPPLLYRLELGTTEKGAAQLVPWSRGPGASAAAWPGAEPAQRELAARIVPLVRLPLSGVRASASGRCDAGGRCTVEVRLDGDRLVRGTVSLVTHGSKEARVVGLYAVPGTDRAVVVLEYIGTPVEGGYSHQLVALLRQRGSRGDEHGGEQLHVRLEVEGPTEQVAEVRLAVHHAGLRREVSLGRFAGACEPVVLDSGEPGRPLARLDCSSGVVLEVVQDGGGLVATSRTVGVGAVRELARLPLAATARVELDELRTAVVASGSFGRTAWRALCAADRGCALLVGERIAFEVDRRGALACAQRDRWLACIHTHATVVHVQEGWFVDLGTGQASPLSLPGAQRIDGSSTRVIGPPVWRSPTAGADLRDPGQLELTVEDGETRRSELRAPPPVRPAP